MSSRLFQEVREKRGLAYSVGSYVVGYADAGQVGVYLGTREDNLGDGLRDHRHRAAPHRRASRCPAEELQRAKDHLKGRLVLGMESSGTRMNRIGRSVLTGTELLTIDEIIARVDAVTAEDVLELAREHWQPETMSAAAIGPEGDVIRAAVGDALAGAARGLEEGAGGLPVRPPRRRAKLAGMDGAVALEPVDAVTVTTLVDNVTDSLLADQGPATRPSMAASPRCRRRSSSAATPTMRCRAEHGFSALVTIVRGRPGDPCPLRRGRTPDGLVENMRRLEICPRATSTSSC